MEKQVLSIDTTSLDVVLGSILGNQKNHKKGDKKISNTSHVLETTFPKRGVTICIIIITFKVIITLMM